MMLKTVLDHSATCALFCTIALAAIGATLPLPAAADPPSSRRTSETSTKIISLSGLDLATPQGQREARVRLARAAEQLCRKLSDDRRVDAWAAYSDCTQEALAKALKQLIPPAYAQTRTQDKPR
jgi:UrcA family protein